MFVPWESSKEVIKAVQQTIKDSLSGRWWWAKNSRCKYIDIRIDMRDGKCVLMDRESQRISIEDLQKQYNPQ